MAKKTLKTLVIGDPHFKVSNAQQTDEMVTSILKIAKEIRPELIVCLGDILDRHETIHVSPLTRATNFLKSLSEVAHLIVIIGNHDRPNNSNFLTNEHPFSALQYWDNITLVDKVKVTTIDNFKFVSVPYVPPGRFREALSTKVSDFSDFQGVTAIFAHQEFQGAKMGAITSTNGDVWPLDLPLVISGHIHDYDHLQTNIIYVGTPIQHAWGDKSDKTISLFTFKSDGTYDQKRLELQVTKQEIVYISPSDLDKFKPKPNVITKLMITGTNAEIKNVVKLPIIKELSKKGIVIRYKTLNSDSDNPVLTEPNKPYFIQLYENISDSEKLIEIFKRLFGSRIE